MISECFKDQVKSVDDSSGDSIDVLSQSIMKSSANSTTWEVSSPITRKVFSFINTLKNITTWKHVYLFFFFFPKHATTNDLGLDESDTYEQSLISATIISSEEEKTNTTELLKIMAKGIGRVVKLTETQTLQKTCLEAFPCLSGHIKKDNLVLSNTNLSNVVQILKRTCNFDSKKVDQVDSEDAKEDENDEDHDY